MMSENHMEEAQSFYKEALAQLQHCGQSFLVGGGFAFRHYTGISSHTKDFDIFCKPSQYPFIIKYFDKLGYRTEGTGSGWFAKVYKDDNFMDIIFDSPNNICTVDDSWYESSISAEFENIPIRLVAVEELLWCKTYVQNREQFDGADINHLLLRQGRNLDWNRLMQRLDRHWQLLLAQLLIFQFIYPSDYRDIIPRRILDGLLLRAAQQSDLPAPVEKVCRGPLLDQTQYATDIIDWQYKAATIK